MLRSPTDPAVSRISAPEAVVALTIGIGLLGTLFHLAQGIPPPRRKATPNCANQLKKISLALMMYEHDHRSFPPAYLTDEGGRPMHSWRVLILPYLDRESLYRQYRFDEPWDGPNNRKLADQIGAVFRCPEEKVDPKSPHALYTSYTAIVGDETVWPGARGVAIADFKDGTANTIVVAEVANSGIHWMEPRDLHVLQMSPTVNPQGGQGISSRHKDGAYALFADGRIAFLKNDTPVATLRKLLTIDGGEPEGGDDP